MTRLRLGVPWALVLGLVALAALGAVLGAVVLPSPRHPPVTLSGPIRAPGGPYLYDRFGRVVFLHGVNVVYKRYPFEVYPDRGKPWNFDAADARRMKKLGFNVVRLGIVWQGLEPGSAPPNDPAICRTGKPGNPHQLNRKVLYRYLDRLRETVDLLGRYHIYTLLDMHQDVYSAVLGGEGAPRWAVCTDGVAPTKPPGRWSLVYGTKAAGIAFHHFWFNNVVGNLQGQFDEVWGLVARFFAGNPWILGFDPFNEPFSTSILKFGGEHFDAKLECFYTGTAHVGGALHGAPPIRCPADDPRTGVIPNILENDPHGLVFDEPDIYASRGFPTYLGPMDLKNLVYNVHVYCADRDPVTGNPTNVTGCAEQDERSLTLRKRDRASMASRKQRKGPAWFVSEFGATSNTTFLRAATAMFDRDLVGWTYWSWKYYGDPTGSQDEALIGETGKLRPSARVLSQTYAEAVSGAPISMSFDPTTGAFSLRYRPNRRIKAPTLVVVPTHIRYLHGYCPRVRGGSVVSKAGDSLLEVASATRARLVDVSVTAGACKE